MGFVYKISHKSTGHYYIGQKVLFNKIKRKPLKGKKNCRRDVKESDWKTYTGSGVISDHARQHPDLYTFEIIELCKSKLEMDLLEAGHILNNIYDPKNLNQCFNFRFRVKKDLPSFI